MSTLDPQFAVIGAGPRGLSLVERLCANIRVLLPNIPITVHVVDPCHAGSGSVWRTDQSGELLMNTVASQITVFTDASVDCGGPKFNGPSLYEWAQLLPVIGERCYDQEVEVEASFLGPNSYPSRRFYGHYLEWVFSRIVATAPSSIVIRRHQSLAVAIGEDEHGYQTVRLRNGALLEELDAVMLAQGHLPVRRTAEEDVLATFASAHSLTYVPPANPADVNLTYIAPGESVIVRGLGLTFFDYLALLTVGRGGSFTTSNGRTVYRASGREPRIVAGSQRGVPYHARGENEKGAIGRYKPRVLTAAVVRDLRARTRQGGVDFRRDVWPLVAKEVETVYYSTLLAGRTSKRVVRMFLDNYLATSWNTVEEAGVLDQFGIARSKRWCWESVVRPTANTQFDDPGEFRIWLLNYLKRDAREAGYGNVSGPLKAALDVLRDLRNEIRLIIDHGGTTGYSYRDDVQGWYTPLNAFLSIGPPASRIEEMIALIEAGVLDVLGPDMRMRTVADHNAFVAYSPLVKGSQLHAHALIEARLPDPDVRRSCDPLTQQMLRTGQCKPYEIPNPDGTTLKTGGLAVTGRPYRIVDANGRAHPRRFAYGVPTEAAHWVTAAGIRPGVNSAILSDADAIARAVLNLAASVSKNHSAEALAP